MKSAKFAVSPSMVLRKYLHNPEPIPEPFPEGNCEVLPIDLPEHVLGLVVAIEVAANLRPPSDSGDGVMFGVVGGDFGLGGRNLAIWSYERRLPS